MNVGSASVIINRPVGEVFAAVTDVSRMGEWSPECVSGQWLPPAEGPAIGSTFSGDNQVKVGPITMKKWTTVSEVTAFTENELFEFTAEGYTTWRYEFEDQGESTKLSESFSYPPYTGMQKFMYDTVLRRSAAMVGGVQETLDRIKGVLERS